MASTLNMGDEDPSDVPRESSRSESGRTLIGKSLPELTEDLKILGQPAFRARQLYTWLYKKFVTDPEHMSDLAKPFRELLKRECTWNFLEVAAEQKSDDGTIKYLFKCHDGETVETVWIPQRGRQTVCVSSQVGCRMGCRFCTTGTMGLKRSLSVAEIISQVLEMKRRHPVSNIVFMGMGEPFDNYDNVLASVNLLIDNLGLGFSRRRVTVSTSGLVPQMIRYAKESPAQLAVSLNSTTNDLRYQLMPVNRRYPIEEIVSAVQKSYANDRRRVTFEYILMKGVNDTDEDARRLARTLRGLPSKINLILFNENPDLPYKRPDDQAVEHFQKILLNMNSNATIRWSRGRDIDAACGQLKSRVRGKHEGNYRNHRRERAVPATGTRIS